MSQSESICWIPTWCTRFHSRLPAARVLVRKRFWWLAALPATTLHKAQVDAESWAWTWDPVNAQAPAIWSSKTGSNFGNETYCPSDSRMKVVVLTKMVSMMKAEITSGVDRFRKHLGLGKGQQRGEGSLPILAVQPQVHTKNHSFKQYFVCHIRHFGATIQTTNDVIAQAEITKHTPHPATSSALSNACKYLCKPPAQVAC